jgi:hypothetical protein
MCSPERIEQHVFESRRDGMSAEIYRPYETRYMYEGTASCYQHIAPTELKSGSSDISYEKSL